MYTCYHETTFELDEEEMIAHLESEGYLVSKKLVKLFTNFRELSDLTHSSKVELFTELFDNLYQDDVQLIFDCLQNSYHFEHLRKS